MAKVHGIHIIIISTISNHSLFMHSALISINRWRLCLSVVYVVCVCACEAAHKMDPIHMNYSSAHIKYELNWANRFLFTYLASFCSRLNSTDILARTYIVYFIFYFALTWPDWMSSIWLMDIEDKNECVMIMVKANRIIYFCSSFYDMIMMMIIDSRRLLAVLVVVRANGSAHKIECFCCCLTQILMPRMAHKMSSY